MPNKLPTDAAVGANREGAVVVVEVESDMPKRFPVTDAEGANKEPVEDAADPNRPVLAEDADGFPNRLARTTLHFIFT